MKKVKTSLKNGRLLPYNLKLSEFKTPGHGQ